MGGNAALFARRQSIARPPPPPPRDQHLEKKSRIAEKMRNSTTRLQRRKKAFKQRQPNASDGQEDQFVDVLFRWNDDPRRISHDKSYGLFAPAVVVGIFEFVEAIFLHYPSAPIRLLHRRHRPSLQRGISPGPSGHLWDSTDTYTPASCKSILDVFCCNQSTHRLTKKSSKEAQGSARRFAFALVHCNLRFNIATAVFFFSVRDDHQQSSGTKRRPRKDPFYQWFLARK